MQKHHSFTLFLGIISIFVVLTVMLGYAVNKPDIPGTDSQADQNLVFTVQSADPESRVQSDREGVFFNISSRDSNAGLYRLSSDSVESVQDFIARKPAFTPSSENEAQAFITDSQESLRLREVLNDEDALGSNILTDDNTVQGLVKERTHYYYDQTRCGGIPAYGAHVNIHVNDAAEVYSVTGALMKGDPLCDVNVTDKQLENIAVNAYTQEFGDVEVSITEVDEYIFDGTVMAAGFSEAYRTKRIEVCSDEYCHAYFVDTNRGRVVMDYSETTDGKNRYVYLGSTQRRENDPPTSSNDVNKVFDIAGEVYDYYMNNHQRDSYDDRGSLIQVRLQSCNQIQASWNGREIFSCTGVADLDVIGHEFQHGVTQKTAGIVYRNEQGALNESLSDIFGAAMDDDDWLMGEEGIRAIRSMENPPQFQHPDSMFSRYYYCGSQDKGGVHINSGVLNKAFYLMSDGGSFNGCSMNGIGRQEAANIVYKALTTHLRGNRGANYRDAYDAINQACDDIHGSNSATCIDVKSAMQSTFMDKQTSGRSRGPKCSGASQPTATCSGNTPPTGGPTTSPTQQPTITGPTNAPISPTTSPTARPSVTTSPTGPTQSPTDPITPTPDPHVITKEFKQTLTEETYVVGTLDITQTANGTAFDAVIQSQGVQNVRVQNEQNLEESGLAARLIGSDTRELGVLEYDVENDTYVISSTVSGDLSQYMGYEIYATPYQDLYDEFPLFVTELWNEDELRQRYPIVLDMQLRFQGIPNDPNEVEAMVVRIGVGGGDLNDIVYRNTVFEVGDDGIWHGKIGFNVPEDDSYRILVKGSRHVQKRYCDNSPEESEPGYYQCDHESVSLGRGINNLDFSRVVQLAGDVNQDGIVNSFDIATVRDNIGGIFFDELYFGDLNHDGVVNAVDDSLVIFTLSNRTDQF